MLPQFRATGAREAFGFQGESGGLATLPTALTINSTTVEPTYWYQAKDASTSSWTTTVGSGGTLTGAGSGGTVGLDSPTPNSADRAVDGDGTRRWDGAAGLTRTTKDIVIEAVLQVSSVTNGMHATTRNAGTGIQLKALGSGGGYGFRVTLLGVGSANVDSATLGIGHVGAMCHLIAFLDKSGSGQVYLQGAASGSPVVISSVGNIADDESLTIGPKGAQAYPDARIAHFALWEEEGLLDTHLQAALARIRYAQTFGLYATGATLQSNSRASAAYVDRVSHVDGIRRLHYVGSGVHRMGRAYDKYLRVGSGYLIESAATQLCLQSEDISTTWALLDAGDTITANDRAAPNGETTADKLTGDATSGLHGNSQAITLTAVAHYFSVYWHDSGTADGIYLDVSTIANVSAYFSSSGVGAVGSAATAYQRYLGGGWYRSEIRYTGTVASHTHRWAMANGGSNTTASLTATVWGFMVGAGAFAPSYIPTTTTTVTRVADALQYDTTGLIDGRATLAADILTPDYNATATQVALQPSDGTSSNRFGLAVLASSDGVYAFSVDGGVTQSNITDSTVDVVDNSWHEIRALFRASSVRQFTDGTEDGTEDTDGTVPLVDQLDIGAREDGSLPFDGLVLPRIYSKPTLKSVTSFGDVMAYSAAYISSAGGIGLNATTYTALAETWTEIATSDFTVSAAGVHTYTGTATKRFAVSVGISSSASAAMDPLLIAVMKNGTETTSSKASRKVPITDVGRMAVVDHVQLANGDTITVGALADSGTPTLTCDYCTVLLNEVS